MIEITIYLKNGVHFSVFVSEFSVKKNGLGDFAGLSWISASNELPHLLHIDITEVVAIVSTHQAAQHRLHMDAATPAQAGATCPHCGKPIILVAPETPRQ
jgi:hypothetical protein